MKRIHELKTAVIVKDTIPDEKIEILRDNCNNLRGLWQRRQREESIF